MPRPAPITLDLSFLPYLPWLGAYPLGPVIRTYEGILSSPELARRIFYYINCYINCYINYYIYYYINYYINYCIN